MTKMKFKYLCRLFTKSCCYLVTIKRDFRTRIGNCIIELFKFCRYLVAIKN